MCRLYFLDRVVAAMEQPNVGLVTTLYTGLPGAPGLAALLGASQINYTFLPGALLARQLGPAGLPGCDHGADQGRAGGNRRVGGCGQ